jgi:hypothetical protein
MTDVRDEHQPEEERRPEEERPPEERRRRATGSIVLGALLAAAGIVWLLAAVDIVTVPVQAGIGAALVLVGLAVALLPAGGHQGVLVTAGIVLALVGAGAATVRVDLVTQGAGETREAPATLEALEEEYAHGVGSFRLDLTRLPLDAGDTVDVRATIGIGELVVLVPQDSTVDARVRMGIGEVRVRERQRSGLGPDLSARIERDGPTLRLDLEGGIGSIRVVDEGTGDADF